MDTFISIAPYICGFLLSVITGCITLEWLTLWRDLALEKEEKEWADRIDRKSTRLNSSHLKLSRMPSSA